MNNVQFTRSKTPNPPLISFKELAKLVGKTIPELRGIFATDARAPKPIRRHERGCYYHPVECKRWWKTRVKADA